MGQALTQNRAIGQMPYRRRFLGMSALERHEERRLWALIAALTPAVAALPQGPARQVLQLLLGLLSIYATSLRLVVLPALTAVNPANKNRLIDSWTDEECWHLLRFRRADLHRLFVALQIPAVVVCPNRTSCPGEHALCLMLYRLAYPTRLVTLQNVFGRELTALSRIFQTIIEIVSTAHSFRVKDISFFRNRFDIYNETIRRKIASVPMNPAPGTVPLNLNPVFAFLDGTYLEIARPHGHGNMQNAFYNKYKKKHCLLWQGVSFPDGMTIVDGPHPGFNTDIMGWRDAQMRQDLAAIMQQRLAAGQPGLKLYADKMYNTSLLVVGAYNRRYGNIIQPWMRINNGIMSRIRVGIEWAFGSIITINKYIAFAPGQKLQENRTLKDYYYVGVLVSNCRCCFYGASPQLGYFDLRAPTINDYLV